VLLVLVLVGLAGFATARLAGPRPAVRAFQAVYLKYVLPILLLAFRALAKIDLKTNIENAGLFYLASAVFLIVTFFLARRLRLDLDASVAALTATFLNTVMVGAPLFECVHASDALCLLYTVVPFHSFFLFPIATLVWWLARGRHPSGPRQGVPFILYAMVIGTILSFFIPSSELTGSAKRAIGIATHFSTFFVIGLSMARVKLVVSGRAVRWMTFVKLVVMPAFIYGVFRVLRPEYAPAATLIAALPAGISTLAYSEAFGERDTAYTSQTILFSTAGSILSLSVWLWALGYVVM
jgi:malonate transporter and related proteins